jgi:hypothetical protein
LFSLTFILSSALGAHFEKGGNRVCASDVEITDERTLHLKL